MYIVNDRKVSRFRGIVNKRSKVERRSDSEPGFRWPKSSSAAGIDRA